jgi:glutamate-ammonia-ligase adenylyltransferase
MATVLSELERTLGLPGLADLLDRHAAAAADPARAAALLPDVLAASAAALRSGWAAHAETAVRAAATLCGAAPFLAPHLSRHGDWLARLVGDALDAPRSAAAYAERLAGALRGEADAAAGLRRFKYYELARLTLRDLWAAPDDVAATEAVLGELSHLADALLAAALQRAVARVAADCGPAQWTTPGGVVVAPCFTVLGMGKLGGEELNYSSDVDLVYVLEHVDAEDGPQALSPVEYYGRVVHELARLVTATTGDGFLYRVDLDLRPEGQAGPLVVPSEMLAQYYDAWAATWEKAAFMKARPVAGDRAFGWRVIRALDPMIYRSAMDYAGVAAIRAMKDRVEREVGRSGGTFNVKIGAGGIRDIEFVAQALQLLHGGRIPDVRERSTQRALTALAQIGILPARIADDLRRAYAFLRRTENRLQMVGERQTHRLPEDDGERRALARALGFTGADPTAEFAAALEDCRARIRAVFAELFTDEGAQPLLDLFQRNVPHLLTQPGTRVQIEQLAARFAHAIDASPNRERAMNNLDRFIRGVGTRSFYYGLLVDRPELVDRLAALFAASEYLSGYMATHPRLIEPIFSDPNVLVLSRAELRAGLARLRADLAAEGRGDEPECSLAALRLLHNRELVNIGLLDLAEKIGIDAAEAGLTDLAEVCIEGGLDLARRELARRRAPSAGAGDDFLVVGMGKLASRELTYGSDLDVIFLYDAPGADDSAVLEIQEYYVHLAQKLIWALQTRTGDGACYQIDARLRPSGNQGLLVTSRASFAAYHAGSAQVWERQALLRARPTVGSAALADAFDALRRQILLRPLPADAAAEIRRVRQRMEAELAQESGPRRDFKIGRGGMLDVESVVQFLQLRHAARHDELLAVDRVSAQIERLARLGLLSAADADTLQGGWSFLERLSSRLRIVENRSISDLDAERGDLDGIATRLGYTSPQRAGGARRALLEDYRRHTAAIRAVYERVLA